MNCMSTLYLIQHVAAEPPGLIALALQDCGVGIEVIRPFKGDRIPSRLGGHAGLVVMGGPMGVYEQDQYPFLRQEIRLLQDALSARRPILGVCLGSQLLAAALGTSVTRGRQKEIGWHPVTLRRAATVDRLWRGVAGSFTAFHWHGDRFDLPPGAVSLARSKLTECQAFRYDTAAYGFLFHLEVTERIIRRMTKTFRNELLEAGVNVPQVLDGARQYLAPLRAIGRTVFERWAALVKGEREAEWNGRTIQAKRVKELPAPGDGARFLVDRLWPRGVKKEALPLEGWLKAVAPSDELRRWFKHDPVKWSEFRRRYFAELDQHPEVVQPILEAAGRGPVTLLFSARDTRHNNAVALAEYLGTRLAVSGTKVQ
jgi:GMP synthase (glutamine-hydrolysing)